MAEHESSFITFSSSTVNNNAVDYQVINITDRPYLPIWPSPNSRANQASNTSINSHLYNAPTLGNTDLYLNQLMKVTQPQDEHESYWFPTQYLGRTSGTQTT